MEKHQVVLLRLRVSRQDQQPPIGCRHPYIHHLQRGHLLHHGSRSQPRRQSPQALPECDVETVRQERDEDMRLDAGVLLVINGPDGQVVLQIPKDRFDLRELNIVLPQQGRIFPGKIRAQQIMTLAAEGLSEFVLAQGEGESLCVDRLLRYRHSNFHQAIGTARLGFGGSQFQQQFVAREFLSLQFVKPLPEAFQPTPTYGALLLPSPLTAGQNVEFALPYQKLYLHRLLDLRPRLLEKLLLQFV